MRSWRGILLSFFFFNDTATTEIYTLSLHDALPIAADVRRRRFPVIGTGSGVFSFIHVDDAASATLAAIEQHAEGAYNVVDDEPAPVADWLPAYAQILGAPAPRRVPAWAGRALGGSYAVYLMTQMPGASNEHARAGLGWRPLQPSWRGGWREDLARAR